LSRLPFLERARSAVKEGCLERFIGVTRSETRSEGSRTKSCQQRHKFRNRYPQLYPSGGRFRRDNRRASLRGDESYFSSASDLQEYRHERHREPYEHPLAQSLTASPDLLRNRGRPPLRLTLLKQSVSVGATSKNANVLPSGAADPDQRPGSAGIVPSSAAAVYSDRSFTAAHSHSPVYEHP